MLRTLVSTVYAPDRKGEQVATLASVAVSPREQDTRRQAPSALAARSRALGLRVVAQREAHVRLVPRVPTLTTTPGETLALYARRATEGW